MRRERGVVIDQHPAICLAACPTPLLNSAIPHKRPIRPTGAGVSLGPLPTPPRRGGGGMLAFEPEYRGTGIAKQAVARSRELRIAVG